MSHLRTKLHEEITLRGLAESTRESYVCAVAELASFRHQSPDRISEATIREFLLGLHRKGLAPQTINVKIAGLRFFFRHVLSRPIDEVAKLAIQNRRKKRTDTRQLKLL